MSEINCTTKITLRKGQHQFLELSTEEAVQVYEHLRKTLKNHIPNLKPSEMPTVFRGSSEEAPMFNIPPVTSR